MGQGDSRQIFIEIHEIRKEAFTHCNRTEKDLISMATKVEAKSEKLFECEVKRKRVRASGSGYEPFWKVKPIAEALVDEDTEFRCMTCGGAVKVFKRRSTEVPTAHLEHKLKSDSEHCAAGLHFLKATDGRLARPSQNPVR